MITNFTVGPAKLYTGVEDFLCECLQKGMGELGHRSAEFTEISKQTIADFRDFFEVPKDYRIFYTYSATEGLELALKNCVEKKSTHVVNGNFGNLWAGLAKKTGAGTKTQEIFSLETENLHHGERVDIQKILEKKPEISDNTEMLCITANETASGVAYSPEEITEISGSALLAVDITSGIGGYAYDFSSADIWAFSVQKALGLPAGLGILIVSPRAYEKSLQLEKQGQDLGGHHSFSALEKKMSGKFQTPSTPNFLGILGLGYISRQFKKDFGTVKNLAEITAKKARNFYDFLENSEISQNLKPLVRDKKAQSNTILVATGDEKFLAEKFSELKSTGIQIGKGYGKFKPQNFRIGNFPVHKESDLENLRRFL